MKSEIKRIKKSLRITKYILTIIAIVISVMTETVLAADPLTTINNLSTFIFSAIKAIGLILLGFGIVQIGLSLKSHDASQRANGFLTVAGGRYLGLDRQECFTACHVQKRHEQFHFAYQRTHSGHLPG